MNGCVPLPIVRCAQMGQWRVNPIANGYSGSLLTTGKAIDEPHLLIRERALHRRNLTLRTAIARSHNSLKPYSNKLPLTRYAGLILFRASRIGR
jgi:hypothetical protein